MDIGRDGPESYANGVGCTIQQESWVKTDKSLNLSTGSAQKEVLQLSPLQMVGDQCSGGRFGFQSRRPNNQNKPGGPSGKPQTGGKRKSGPGSPGRPKLLGARKQARRNFEQRPLCNKC